MCLKYHWFPSSSLFFLSSRLPESTTRAVSFELANAKVPSEVCLIPYLDETGNSESGHGFPDSVSHALVISSVDLFPHLTNSYHSFLSLQGFSHHSTEIPDRTFENALQCSNGLSLLKAGRGKPSRPRRRSTTSRPRRRCSRKWTPQQKPHRWEGGNVFIQSW